MTAREFAIQAHGEQRYGEFPYEKHLKDVVHVLLRFEYIGRGLMDAAWLHDATEDCGVPRADISERFGDDVADAVWAVTGVGENRKSRNADAYRKIRAYGKRALVLKLADRIANTEHSIAHQTRHLEMYRREFPAFEAALFVAGEADAMWAHLRAISTADADSPVRAGEGSK